MGSLIRRYPAAKRTGDTMHASGSARIQQRLKIEEIGTTLAECGFVALDEQAYVLGLSRSTTWTVLRAIHKNSGLSAMTINRMLATGRLPPRVRQKLLEYIAAKMSGAYGDQEHRLKAFASRISPVHMHAALFQGAKPDTVHEDVHRAFGQFEGQKRRAL
jgi:predicted DNA-binding transcriptional regulator AlpA